MDVHEATSTVKEALIFSAVLRQPRDIPHKEKLAYVDHIIELLELQDICDALIGSEYCLSPPA
jgi:ABC-type multidrug transport system ATPase subunit